MSKLPGDYLHKIYAGVLGKLIGVYLGRPFENWTYQEIHEKLGPIHYYVHERLGLPLVVIDDDVSGTFAFVRALEEHGARTSLSPEEVGKTWLNTVIDKRTIFWWGGHGISTEHTTFNNLKNGLVPPLSGSMKTNGKTLSEQIGSQIFIDGWALVTPGNPSLAAKLAEAAALVSHDGVAVDAAKLWAVMEAEAFVSSNVDHLLDTGLSFIPQSSTLRPLIADIRAWAKEDSNWEKTRQRIEDNYGYDRYGGICHMIPNHGIMIMALIYGGHDFSHAMHIINTAGWDTDCNSGNVGCLVAIMHGLPAFDNDRGLDWRGPLADRALISNADNGYSINNAVRITYDLANLARKLAGEDALEPPKDGAQFHFSLPGSVQGFQANAPPNVVTVCQGQNQGDGALGIHLHALNRGNEPIEVLTQTFTPVDVIRVKRDYEMMASPLIYPGQRVKAILSADKDLGGTAYVRLRVKAYDFGDELFTIDSDACTLEPRGEATLNWTLPQSLNNKPIQQLGIAITPEPNSTGKIWLHSIKYGGVPQMELKRPSTGAAEFWQRAWVNSVDKVHTKMGPSFYIAQDDGEGLFTQGTRDWNDYRVTFTGFTVNLGGPSGVVVQCQGLNRYYGVVLCHDGYLAIVKARDEERDELARARFGWELDTAYNIAVTVKSGSIYVCINDVELSAFDDEYRGGALGLLVKSGSISTDTIQITSLSA